MLVKRKVSVHSVQTCKVTFKKTTSGKHQTPKEEILQSPCQQGYQISNVEYFNLNLLYFDPNGHMR